MARNQSAADAAFTSLTVGIHFSRARFEHQRQLFEEDSHKTGSHNKNSHAAPVVIASDGTILTNTAAASANNAAASTASSGAAIHAMVAALPKPRLDFITHEVSEEEKARMLLARQQQQQDENSKKKKRIDDDDAGQQDGDEEEAAAKQLSALKPAGRKQVGNFLTKHDVSVKGTNHTTPGAVPVDIILHHFSELLRSPINAPKAVIDNLFARQLTKPTVIQSIAIPLLAAARRNVLGCAPTGSGKTIGFLVPMFSILKQPEPTSDGVRALIVAPTKELAAQIEREAQFLMKGQPWRTVQYGHTTKGKDLFVTTPARAVSMAEAGTVSLSRVKYLVFDEGDKLWEGTSDFSQQVKQIVAFVNGTATAPTSKKNNAVKDDGDDATAAEAAATSKRDLTVAFFSATLPPKAERLARTFMPDPVLVVIRGRVSANSDCEQKLLFTGTELGKVTAIRNMVTEGEMRPPVLIFVQSIERSKELYDEIKAAKLRVAVLHADLSSEDRDRIVLKFRMGEIWVLITTELLARGVDFKGVETVINFDLPLTAESYVHRIGRTGRAGHKGTAVTFFTEDDKLRVPPIAKIVHESGSPVAPYLLEMKQPTQKQLRQLERSVPQRLAVSTRKRARIGEERIMRQANKYCRKDDEEDSDDGADGAADAAQFGGGGDDDDEDGQKQQRQQRGKNQSKKKQQVVSRKKIPNRSVEADEDFE